MEHRSLPPGRDVRTMGGMGTASSMLALVNDVITKRLRGDGYESYTANQQQFRGTSLADLYALRKHLQQEVAAESGGNFHLARPDYQ